MHRAHFIVHYTTVKLSSIGLSTDVRTCSQVMATHQYMYTCTSYCEKTQG